ncbi:MAG: acetate/propionate family kinase [Candidatus Paceibacterota bacterium]|jgi:acetate kinase
MSKNLIVNTGSASKKYAIYERGQEIAFVHLEIGEGGFVSTIKTISGLEKEKISKKDWDNSLNFLVDLLKNKNIISDKKDISKVGIRVVAPGLSFQKNSIIDNQYLKDMKEAEGKAPLHMGMILEEIKKIKKFFGKDIPLVGISDSTFHNQMPDKAKLYAIPLKDAKKYEIYRYGYHGISLRSIVEKLREKEALPEKLIVCHIGGGVSITAIKNGISIDTTMGFTPLEGMVMANRVGDIDSGALVYISEKLRLNNKRLMGYLNKECGLLGLSGGLSADIRDLLRLDEEENNIDAKNALDVYAYRIQKQIGAYAVSLGGLDAVVFSATVGERSFKMRKRICEGLEFLGLKLDECINNATEGVEAEISSAESRVKVFVVKTDEMKVLAEGTEEVVVL